MKKRFCLCIRREQIKQLVYCLRVFRRLLLPSRRSRHIYIYWALTAPFLLLKIDFYWPLGYYVFVINKLKSMDKDNLEKIKTQLLDNKARLEMELSKFAKKNAEVPGDYNATFPEFGESEDENAQEVAEYENRRALEQTLESELEDVLKSLKAIEDGTYGICKYCQEPIDEARLLARPTSSSCVACKKKLKGED